MCVCVCVCVCVCHATMRYASPSIPSYSHLLCRKVVVWPPRLTVESKHDKRWYDSRFQEFTFRILNFTPSLHRSTSTTHSLSAFAGSPLKVHTLSNLKTGDFKNTIQTNETWHTFEWAMARTWMSPGTQRNESWHTNVSKYPPATPQDSRYY